MAKKQALGKGLGALLSNPDTDITSKGIGEGNAKTVGSIAEIAVAEIEANPFNPRTKFEEEALNELSNSIKEHGVIQPITVRKMGYDKYQIISGERRFRASQLAGLEEVPAYIRVANDQTMLEMALVENIQREDLDAIEVALSYQRLMDECNLTQQALSEKVAKKRSTITNYLRLLNLPAEIQLAIRDKKISMGHARSLVSIDNKEVQMKIFNTILEKGISVREVERLAKEAKSEPVKSVKTTISNELSFEHLKIKDDLTRLFNTKVDLTRNDIGRGKITINFNSDSELDKIVELLDI